MTNSMTGFGQAQTEKKGERFIVTLKSVNHRYFETSFRLPIGLEQLESFFRAKIQKNIKRGRIEITVTHLNEAGETVMLNHDLAEKYFYALETARKRLKLAEGLSLDALVSLPGVVSYKREGLKVQEKEVLLRAALDEALRKLLGMRAAEGGALAADLSGRVDRILGHMLTIKKRVDEVIEANKRTMSNEALEAFLRSTDVSEEITRIEFHLKSFLKQMKLKDPKGKILDFIGQELQREINTLGAKVQDKHVAYQVVMIKDQIEKIREQVQNVE